ncbi:MAG: carboxypeptidase-like regulatory domain-containing protein [Sphingobacteriaceae bacterium]|nr:carboxypeptidase-like regulatory domain-containing protein [Sphingobacteriaceae bacterium]
MCIALQAQTITGKVIDERNKQPIPFAFVGINNTNLGTTTDIDGNFSLKLNSGASLLIIQIVSYEKTQIDLSAVDVTKPLIIKLRSADISLMEVVVTPKENPANEIIRRVIKNKGKLDPRNLPFYSCETYGKTYFTASTTEGDEFYYDQDTARFKKDKKFLDKQYFFLIESASEKKYIYKNITQERILASRVSGFKSAPFASLASQLQSFTFFDKNIDVMDIKYVNPLQKGTFKRYRFDIRDTIVEGIDTTILIDFKPRNNTNFKALKGALYINKNDHALANVIAQPSDEDNKLNAVKIQQLYKRVNDKQWFPVQLVTEVLFKNAQISASDEKGVGRIMKCVSRLYVSDVNLDSTIKIKKKNIEVINEKGYENKDENYWKTKRNDSLSEKEKRTYSIIDSVGKAEKFEKKIEACEDREYRSNSHWHHKFRYSKDLKSQ